MTKWIMYIVIGLVIVAAITHPAGSAAGMTAAGNVLTGESAILSGQNNTGGQHGTVSNAGSYYSF